MKWFSMRQSNHIRWINRTLLISDNNISYLLFCCKIELMNWRRYVLWSARRQIHLLTRSSINYISENTFYPHLPKNLIVQYPTLWKHSRTPPFLASVLLTKFLSRCFSVRWKKKTKIGRDFRSRVVENRRVARLILYKSLLGIEKSCPIEKSSQKVQTCNVF